MGQPAIRLDVLGSRRSARQCVKRALWVPLLATMLVTGCARQDLAPSFGDMPSQYVATGKELTIALPVVDEDLATVQFSFASTD